MTRTRSGFTILGAIFLLVILSAAGAAMLRVAGVQRTTTSYDLLGARAYYAARSGIEWAIHEAVDSGACAASAAFSLNEVALDGFDLEVTCTATIHVQAAQSTTVYRVVSEAERGVFGTRDYARRQLEATIAIPAP